MSSEPQLERGRPPPAHGCREPEEGFLLAGAAASRCGLGAAMGVVAALAVSNPAVADERLRVALEYDVAGAHCPHESEFRGKVTRLLEYDPFVAKAPRTVAVGISQTTTGLLGILQWRGADGGVQGERRFDDSDCEKLAQNIAFAVTVQLQLLNTPQADGSEPLDDPQPNPERSPKPRTDAESTHGANDADGSDIENRSGSPQPLSTPASLPPAESMELGAGTGLFVVFGWSPQPSAGSTVFLTGRNKTVSARVGFESTLRTRFQRVDDSGFSLFVLAGSVMPCLRFQSFDACTLLRVGQVRVRGFGVDEPRSPKGAFSQLGLRLAGALQLWGPLELQGHAQALRTLIPWSVQLNHTEAFRSPGFSFLLGLDFAVYFL